MNFLDFIAIQTYLTQEERIRVMTFCEMKEPETKEEVMEFITKLLNEE